MQTLFQSRGALVLTLIVIVMTAFLCGGAVALFAFDRLAAPPREVLQPPTLTPSPVSIRVALTTETPSPATSTATPTASSTPTLNASQTARRADPPTVVTAATSTPAPEETKQGSDSSNEDSGKLSGSQPASPSARKLPDLMVSPSSGIAGGSLKRGQKALIVVEGTNRGEADAFNVPVKVDIQLQVLGTFVTLYAYSEVLPKVAGGQTVRREFSGTLPEQLVPGTYRVILRIDPDNTIEESNKNNNALSAVVPLE